MRVVTVVDGPVRSRGRRRGARRAAREIYDELDHHDEREYTVTQITDTFNVPHEVIVAEAAPWPATGVRAGGLPGAAAWSKAGFVSAVGPQVHWYRPQDVTASIT